MFPCTKRSAFFLQKFIDLDSLAVDLFITVERPKEMLKLDGDIEEFKVIYEVNSEILDHLYHVNFEFIFGGILSSE